MTSLSGSLQATRVEHQRNSFRYGTVIRTLDFLSDFLCPSHKSSDVDCGAAVPAPPPRILFSQNGHFLYGVCKKCAHNHTTQLQDTYPKMTWPLRMAFLAARTRLARFFLRPGAGRRAIRAASPQSLPVTSPAPPHRRCRRLAHPNNPRICLYNSHGFLRRPFPRFRAPAALAPVSCRSACAFLVSPAVPTSQVWKPSIS